VSSRAVFPDSLPTFLRDAGSFQLHLDAQFDGRDKGDGFVEFVAKLLPLCEFWGDMPAPTPNPKKSHDRGVDLTAEHPTRGGRFIVQAKYRMREVADLDAVISKWSAYERHLSALPGEQPGLFPESRGLELRYVLITASDLGEISRRYRDSRLPSLEFYQGVWKGRRLEVVDGPRLLGTLQTLYSQSYLIEPQIDLELGAEPIHLNGVYLSVIAGKVLRRLHERFGSSLFFENIREFLGGTGSERRDGRGSVNEAISMTLREAPQKMLGRNNGITFRADAVAQSGRTLQLQRGSIVNGCQTTMCIVEAGAAADDALVAVKIVVGEESWEVAKSANYQNQVSRIELELARFLRPQVVRKIATDLGYSLGATAEPSISNVLEDIHHTKVSYEAIRLLYIGLFSWYPGNIFEGHYSKVRLDVLAEASARGRQEYVMRVLFQLIVQMFAASDEFKARHRNEEMVELFRRFFREEEPRYMCLLGLVTACGCAAMDLGGQEPSSAQPDTEAAWAKLERLLGRLELVLTRHKDVFNRVFRHVVVALAGPVLHASRDQQDLLQRMSKEIEGMASKRFPLVLKLLEAQLTNDDQFQRIDFEDPPPLAAPKGQRRGGVR